ncbi:hypothetical protein B296_00002980 [Ensete ventricosum]|uniref:Uncharacterized protein n=1 Tax=Ensete ventricosum TaxID=4639 RepID=A0A427AF54_ENSVE|nr:hypothetical protein B296_00002980 [Ensete ventricosum]
MKSVGRDSDNDGSTSRLLATLRDHFGSVNCVRWAKHGRFLASGSDDQVILIHERKPGSGTTEFGSGEPPDVENWKVTMTLRGHTADVATWVVALSPDGYALFACSLDGTVATFHFEVKELGHRLTDAELDEIKRSRYGDVRGRQANVADSPAQLLLEAVCAKQSANRKGTSNVEQNQISGKASIEPVNAINSQSIQKATEPQVRDGKKNGEGSVDDLNKISSVRLSSPPKQREYRRPDGRKRIIPEAVGLPAHKENLSAAQAQLVEFSSLALDQAKGDRNAISDGVKETSLKRPFSVSYDAYSYPDKCNNCGSKERSGITARANINESLIIEKAPTASNIDGRTNVEHMGSIGMPSSLTSCNALSIRVFNKKDCEDSLPICLEAKPIEQSVHDVIGVGNAFVTKETEIRCTKGSETLWSDRISGKITVLAGNANFWAVGCEDGCLQVQ